MPDFQFRSLAPYEIPEYVPVPNTPYFNILVPTTDTVRYSFLTNLFIESYAPLLITGETGVGKSVIISSLFSEPPEEV
jgi:dynein heavy chain